MSASKSSSLEQLTINMHKTWRLSVVIEKKKMKIVICDVHLLLKRVIMILPFLTWWSLDFQLKATGIQAKVSQARPHLTNWLNKMAALKPQGNEWGNRERKQGVLTALSRNRGWVWKLTLQDKTSPSGKGLRWRFPCIKFCVVLLLFKLGMRRTNLSANYLKWTYRHKSFSSGHPSGWWWKNQHSFLFTSLWFVAMRFVFLDFELLCWFLHSWADSSVGDRNLTALFWTTKMCEWFRRSVWIPPHSLLRRWKFLKSLLIISTKSVKLISPPWFHLPLSFECLLSNRNLAVMLMISSWIPRSIRVQLRMGSTASRGRNVGVSTPVLLEAINWDFDSSKLSQSWLASVILKLPTKHILRVEGIRILSSSTWNPQVRPTSPTNRRYSAYREPLELPNFSRWNFPQNEKGQQGSTQYRVGKWVCILLTELCKAITGSQGVSSSEWLPRSQS